MAWAWLPGVPRAQGPATAGRLCTSGRAESTLPGMGSGKGDGVRKPLEGAATSASSHCCHRPSACHSLFRQAGVTGRLSAMSRAGPRSPPRASGCHTATAHAFAWALLLNYCDLARLRAPRAVGHVPYARALPAPGGGLLLPQLCSAKWWLLSKHSAPRAQEARPWHSEVPLPRSPGPSLSAVLSSIHRQRRLGPAGEKRQEVGSQLLISAFTLK